MKATKQQSDKVTKKQAGSAPVTMEELLASISYQPRGFKRGDTVKGRVTEVSGKTVFVGIGGKTDAVVAEAEYENSKDYMKSLKVGDEVTGYVISPENDAGQVVLSLRKAAADSKWKIFEEAMNEGTVVSVKGKEVNKGGLLVDAFGVYGFIPASQFSKELSDKAGTLVGQNVQVKVIEVDREQNRLVFSEKAVSEAEEIEKRKKLLAAVKIGESYDGKVVGLVPFGAFVEVKVKKGVSLEGLVHISEISWEKIEDVGKVFKEGDEVKVRVIGIDEETGKLALSMKQLSDDPWKVVEEKYKVDSKHTGKVVKIAPYGVFVHMERGIEGLIHASKMPADRSFVEGEEVNVFVESADLEKRRLSLGVVLTEKPVGYK